MAPTASPAPPDCSTRLENLSLSPYGVSFEFDGRRVDLSPQTHPGGVSVFRGFYEHARGDYAAHAAVAPERPAWLDRFRSWLARLFSARPEAAPRLSTGREPPLEPPGSPPAPPPPPPPGPHVVAREPAPFRARAPAQPLRSTPDAAPPRPSSPRGPKPGAGPVLRAAFADPSGVRLVWLTAAGRDGKETELIYPHDSEVGKLLQGCYERLSELGYPIVDLRVWQKEVGAKPAAPKPTEPEAEEPARPRPVAAPSSAKPESAPAAKPAASFVMRLLPGTSDNPGRAVVSPVEDEGNLQVLLAPERLVRALHSAAEPARPAAERLTYLRCVAGRGGLKIAAVGLGEGKGHAPARWEELDAWWKAAQKNPAPPVAGPAPIPAAEPGLF